MTRTKPGTNVGSYTSTASCNSVTGGRAKCGNYTLASNTKAYTITKVEGSFSCSNKTYNGSEQTACTCSGGTLSEEYKATNYRSSVYTAKCTPDGNHTLSSTARSWRMNKYTPSIAITPTSKTGTVTVGYNTTFTATPTVIAACKGTLTAVSENTNYVTILSGGTTWNATSAVDVNWKGIAANTGTKINVNYAPTDTANCNSATQQQYTAVVNGITKTGTFYYCNGTAQASTTATCTQTTVGGTCNYTVPSAVQTARSVGGTAYSYRGVTYADANTSTPAGNATVSTPTSAHPYYYASYSATITVSYNGNSNTSGTVPSASTGTGYLDSACSPLAASITLASPNPILKKTGYQQNGWQTTSDGGTGYNLGETVSFTANQTLYTRWRINKTTVRYHANGGIAGNPNNGYTVGSDGLVYKNGTLLTSSINYGATAVNLLDIGHWYDTSSTTAYNIHKVGYNGNNFKTSNGTAINKDNTTYALLNDNTTPSGDTTVTLYVQWARNFTCANVGSETTYAGKKWTTIAKDGTWCTLAGNFQTSKTGTYNAATTNLNSSFFTSGQGDYNATMLAEKNAGLLYKISGDYYIDTNGGTTGTKPSGVWWYQGGKVWDTSARTYYSLTGFNVVANIDNSGGLVTKTAHTLNSHSRAAGSLSIGNAASSITVTDGKASAKTLLVDNSSKRFSEKQSTWTPKSGTTSKIKMNLIVAHYESPAGSLPVYENQWTRENGIIQINVCGGKCNNNYVKFTKKSTTQYNYHNLKTGTNSNYNYSANKDFIFAGSAVHSESGTTSTYNNYGSTTCKDSTYGTYTLSDNSIAIHYRPRIKVKLT